jgi:hypothetical protein
MCSERLSDIGRQGQFIDAATLTPNAQHSRPPVDVIKTKTSDLTSPQSQSSEQVQNGRIS